MVWLSCIASNVVLASILALAAWFVQRQLRRPATARILWLLALVKLLTPPLISVPLVDLPGTMACTLGVCHCEHAGLQTILRDVSLWCLMAAWLAGAGAAAWTTCCRATRFRRLIAHSGPAPPEWQSLAAKLSSELALRRTPRVLSVPGRLPPLVVPGRRRPRILIPAALMSQLNASQREALLLHELTHIRRGDHWVRLLEATVRVVFWWLPFVGSIGRQLRACEETCCDAAVVARRPHARRDYARLLLDVIDFANPLPWQAAPQVTAMSAFDDIEQRLRAILDTTQRTRRALPAGVLWVSFACAILPCQLHFDFVRPALPAALSGSESWIDGCEPAAGASVSPGKGRCVPLAVFRCPP